MTDEAKQYYEITVEFDRVEGTCSETFEAQGHGWSAAGLDITTSSELVFFSREKNIKTTINRAQYDAMTEQK